MNYYDTDIYYLMYAGSIIKMKMQKLHAFLIDRFTVHARTDTQTNEDIISAIHFILLAEMSCYVIARLSD